MKSIIIASHFLLILLMTCDKEDTVVENTLNPEMAQLRYPENLTECVSGSVLSQTKSVIGFEWEQASNTDLYEIHIKEIGMESVTQLETPNTNTDISLERGKAYQWYVVSKSNKVADTALSKTWVFYNEGPGILNHAPFPATLEFPQRGSTLSGLETCTMKWTGQDLDNDIIEYELFMGTDEQASGSLGITETNSFGVTVSSGNTYYWKVRSVDESGNSTLSDVHWFRVD